MPSVTPVGGQNINAASRYGNQVMGKDDFLKMFVTTLKYQDPLNPMSNEEFAAQLANFSQLEELQNMNDSLAKTLDSNLIMTQSINNSLATTLIGKDIKSSNSQFEFTNGQSDIELNFNVSENSKKVTIKIFNENGDLVDEIEKANVARGDSFVKWDGVNDFGNAPGDGLYTFTVEAVDENDNNIAATTFKKLRITGVKYIDGMANLMVEDGTTIALGEVMEVLMPS